MKYIVIKCGGSVLEQLPQTFYKNIVQLHDAGEWQPVIVHGGGPLISSLLTNLGVETQFVDGLRVTTNEILDVVEMVLSGSVNKQIVRSLLEAGGLAYGISGVDGKLLKAKPTENARKLGYVGEVVQVNKQLIDDIINKGHIPVISPLAIDDNGQRYNINGDVAASAIAQSLQAKLCFISDIPGIYTEVNGMKETLHEVTKANAEQMIEQEIIKGGMIPKVRAGIDGLTHKVEEVAIINGVTEDTLLHYLEGKKVGTKIKLGKEIHHV